MRCVRVLLAKKGRAKYTSHLDMQRCMMRAASIRIRMLRLHFRFLSALRVRASLLISALRAI